jgi:hypothetical protein
MRDIVLHELARQQTHIELIASENLASCTVMQVLGPAATLTIMSAIYLGYVVLESRIGLVADPTDNPCCCASRW